MYEKELFDETLDINSTNNYEISIQLGLDGFSFSLLDKLRNRFVMLRDYPLDGKKEDLIPGIKNIVEKDEFLARQYRKYRIVFSYEKSTIIPAKLYDPAIKNEYFKLNHNIDDDCIVSNNRLDNPDAYLLFGIPASHFDLACSLFPEASLSHQTRPLVDSSFRQFRKSGGRYVRVHIDRGFFTLVVINEDKLEFFNTFRARNDSDVLYFLMNSFEQLGISSEQAVHLSGNIEKFDDLYNNMLRYIKTLKLARPEGDYSMSYIFDELGTHKYCNLFNIVNCA